MSLPALSGYRVLRAVGAGGMAELFLAERDTAEGTRRQVVLKRILPGLARDPRFRKRFVHEARLALQLTHANIVHVNDFREADDTYVLEMEYVDGCDLGRLLGDGPLSLLEALQVVIEVLRGLDYAHRRIGSDDIPLEIVHRDVAPGNILISREGEVKLADFGLARSREQLEHSAAGVRGTFAFIAPEQAEGLPVDARADLFSVGAVLYAALTGHSPFAADGPLATLERVRAARVPPSGAPPEIDAILTRALARERERRFASAAAMREAIEAACVQLGLRTSGDGLAQRVRRMVATETPLPAAQPAVAQERVDVNDAPTAASRWTAHPGTQRLARRAPRRHWGRRTAAVIGMAVVGAAAAIAAARYAGHRRSPAAAARVPSAAVDTSVSQIAVGRAPATAIVAAPGTADAPAPARPRADAVPGASPSSVGPAAAPAASRPARPRLAYLTVNADPWAYVTIDGKRRGTTPLVDLALPPGAHEVTLDNPELGASRARVITLAPAEHRTVIERLVP